MDSTLYHEFARLEDSHWWFRARRAIIRRVLQRWLGPSLENRKLLDVGCGTGSILELLGEFGQAEGFDSSPVALGYSRCRLGAGVPLHQGSLPHGLPVGGRFDVVTAFDVIEHLDDPVEALRAIGEVLLPGGYLFLTVPAFTFLWGPHDDINHHRRRYTKSLLLSQLDLAGYSLRYCSYFNSILFAPIAGVRLLGRLWRGKCGSHNPDIEEWTPNVNVLLYHIFSWEQFLIPHVRLPFGVSLVAVAQRQ